MSDEAARIQGVGWAYGVLVVSIVIEAASFRVAYREFKQTAHGRSILQVVRDTRDPLVVTVLARTRRRSPASRSRSSA